VKASIYLIALLAGCGAELGGGQPGVDASRQGSDGEPPLDPPADARPCMGGQASAVDTSTGACFVYFTGPLTYNEATTACTTFGAQLAVVKSAQTNAAVLSIVGATDAFLGADDRTVEDTYRWRGDVNDPVSAGYTNWRTGEPNNGNDTHEEDCMIIEGARGGTWDDRPCDPTQVATAGAYAYVCQF
jgi:hypothetical protein